MFRCWFALCHKGIPHQPSAKLILWSRNNVITSSKSVTVLRYVANISVLSGHIRNVLIANNRLASIYSSRCTLTRPVCTLSKRTLHKRYLPGSFAHRIRIAGLILPVEARHCATQLNWNSFLDQSYKNSLRSIPFYILLVRRRRASHSWTLPMTASIHCQTLCLLQQFYHVRADHLTLSRYTACKI